MEALILGVGDAFTRLHFGSSALLRGPGGFVMIDCPDPIHRVLREATSRALAAGHAHWRADGADIHDIIITHLHGDHCNGLESFGFQRHVSRLEGRDLPLPRIHTTVPVRDRLWERLAPAMDGATSGSPRRLSDFFDVRLLDPDGEVDINGLRVRCRFTGHSVPTIGLIVADGAHSLGWSGDTPFERAHIDWLDAADVIVHESNLGPVHTPIERLQELPKRLRRKIGLIHLPDDFDASRTDMHVLRAGDVLALAAASPAESSAIW